MDKFISFLFCCTSSKEKKPLSLPNNPKENSNSSTINQSFKSSSSNQGSLRYLLETSYRKKTVNELIEENKEIIGWLKPTPEISKKKYYTKWTENEDIKLKELYKKFGGKWELIGSKMGKTENQVAHRWRKIRTDVIRKLWTEDEDQKLLKLFEKYGKNWHRISKEMTTRTGKQIRDRFNNVLNPEKNNKEWKIEEDYKIKQLYGLYGPKWTLIAKFMEGRTENMIKNRFKNHLKKDLSVSLNNDVKFCLPDKKIEENRASSSSGKSHIPHIFSKIDFKEENEMGSSNSPITLLKNKIKSLENIERSPHLYESEKSLFNSIKNLTEIHSLNGDYSKMMDIEDISILCENKQEEFKNKFENNENFEEINQFLN